LELKLDQCETKMKTLVGFIIIFLPLLVVGGKEETSALLYLSKYGYIDKDDGNRALVTEDNFKDYIKSAVQDFQAFAGLETTGELDPVTVELMGTPRCGVKDKGDAEPAPVLGSDAKSGAYVLQGSRWQVKHLTYRILTYPAPGRLSNNDVDTAVREAFEMWEAVTDLTFSRKNSGTVHIEIRFDKYEHGDGDPFDGPGGTLAHAYFPQFGGDMHVDDSEYWSVQSFKGTNLKQTIVHELGHSLGLSHSDKREAVMAPFYRGWDPHLKLSNDDVKAIQSLYGLKRSGSPSSSIPKASPVVPRFEPTFNNDNICANPTIDAIFLTADRSTYVFKGDSYWKLTRDSVADGYPRKISQDWRGLPSNIDAAFTWESTKATYFIKGSKYWKFVNRNPYPGYPKNIKDGFPGIPNNVDTAFVWSGNGKIYFFKNSQYWKFDPEKQPHVRTDQYPKSVSLWSLPDNIDGAFQWDNGRTYFFKSGNYWRYNDRSFSVDRGDPAFPRPTAQWWFGCPKENHFSKGLGKSGDYVVTLVNNKPSPETSDDDIDYGYDYYDGVEPHH